MCRAGRNGNRVAGSDGASLVGDLHAAGAFQDVIDLFGDRVVVRRGRTSRRQTGFGQTLLADAGVPRGQQLADLGTVLRDERRHVTDVLHVHGGLV